MLPVAFRLFVDLTLIRLHLPYKESILDFLVAP
jgi:hypothetical protein